MESLRQKFDHGDRSAQQALLEKPPTQNSGSLVDSGARIIDFKRQSANTGEPPQRQIPTQRVFKHAGRNRHAPDRLQRPGRIHRNRRPVHIRRQKDPNKRDETENGSCYDDAMPALSSSFRLLHPPAVLGPELLESRIAPAAAFVSSRTVTYEDLDGDTVVISSSVPIFTKENLNSFFTFSAGILVEIDLTTEPGNRSATGTSLSIQAKTPRGGQGDGLVNIGYINATGVDLRAVSVDGDLGQIDAGDANLRTPALGALTARSLGVFGARYGTPGLENFSSDFRGGLGPVKILNDIREASISVSGDGTRPAFISRIFIGGSLFGSDNPDTGKIQADGLIGSVTVGGSIHGGTGARSGRIEAGSSMGSFFVRGSIVGGSGESSGSIQAGTHLSQMRLLQDLSGGEGINSGSIQIGIEAKSVLVGGSISGGPGDLSGRISSGDDIDFLTLAGDLRGGSGDDSGTVDCGDDIRTLRVGGSILGGKGDDSGGIRASGDITNTRIQGNIVGASLGANSTASINTSGYLKADHFGSLSILGSVVAGENKIPSTTLATTGVFTPDSTLVSGLADTSSLRPGFKVVSGGFSSKILSVDSLNSVTLEDPFTGATATTETVLFSSPTLAKSGLIYARETFGSISVFGDLRGNPTQQVLLVSKGLPDDNLPLWARSSLALGKLFVGGSVSHSLIGTGLDDSGAALNPDAQIGSVQVNRNWVRSNLVAGVSSGPDSLYGTSNDLVATPGPGYANRANLVSQIASIRIGGQVLGSLTGSPSTGTDHFGFVATKIGSVRISGVALRLSASAVPDVLTLSAGTGSDFSLREISPTP
jgi:hypothetical protein